MSKNAEDLLWLAGTVSSPFMAECTSSRGHSAHGSFHLHSKPLYVYQKLAGTRFELISPFAPPSKTTGAQCYYLALFVAQLEPLLVLNVSGN